MIKFAFSVASCLFAAIAMGQTSLLTTEFQGDLSDGFESYQHYLDLFIENGQNGLTTLDVLGGVANFSGVRPPPNQTFGPLWICNPDDGAFLNDYQPRSGNQMLAMLAITSDTTVELTFDEPVFRFGAYWATAGPTNIHLDYLRNDGALIFEDSIRTSSSSNYIFRGLESSEQIKSIVFSTTTTEGITVLMDDMRTTLEPVPEVNPAVALAFGVAPLFLRRRVA